MQNDTLPILSVRPSAQRREPYFEYWQPWVNTTEGFHTGRFPTLATRGSGVCFVSIVTRSVSVVTPPGEGWLHTK